LKLMVFLKSQHSDPLFGLGSGIYKIYSSLIILVRA